MSYQPQPTQAYWQGQYQQNAQPPHPGEPPAYLTGQGVQPTVKRNRLRYVAGGVGAVLLLCAGGTTMYGISSKSARTAFDAGYSSAQATSPRTVSPSAAPASAQPVSLTTTPPTTAAALPVSVTTSAPTATVLATTAAAVVTAPPVLTVRVPNGVGLNYQQAQDLWRAAGLHVWPAHDATGAHRLPILDSNWVVLAQDLTPGKRVASGSFITATVKKYTDG